MRDYPNARKKELKGLLNVKCLTIVPRAQAKGHRIYGTRFEDTVKFEGLP